MAVFQQNLVNGCCQIYEIYISYYSQSDILLIFLFFFLNHVKNRKTIPSLQALQKQAW